MANLQPQAALEQATLNALLASGAPGGGVIPASQCSRMFDGQPPARCGTVFYAVWSDAARRNEGHKTSYSELFNVSITVTIRLAQPADRWLIHRDDLEARVNAAVFLIGQDQQNFSIVNAANALAGFRSSGGPATGAPPGWVESLLFAGLEAVKVIGPDWFQAATDSDSGKPSGIAQRIRFEGARRIRGIMTA